MRILFFINHLADGGAERVAATLLNHLCEQHSVEVVLFSNKESTYDIDNKIHTQKIITGGNNKIINTIKRISRIRKTIKESKPDLIISFLTYTNIYVLLANVFIRRKTIVSEHNTLNRTKSLCIRIIRRLIYSTADKITFVTNADRQNFALREKSITIYNPATFESYANYTNRQKSIISITSYERWYNKGLDLLIKAWNKIAPQNPNWNIEIFGRMNNGKLPGDISYQNTERIKFSDWRKNIAEEMRTKSIFILASRFEGCPCSLIEAMSQGCACIVTNCQGGQKEIVEDGVDGLIAQNENVDDIAAKLQLLIEDEKLRERLSAGAIEKVKLLDKSAFFAKWDKLIDEVTAK